MIRLTALALVLTSLAGPALAQPDLLSAGTFGAVVNVRAASTGGEMSWTEGGFGKTRFGDGSDSHLADGIVEWRPKFGWALSGVADLTIQPDRDEHPVDLGEAYIQFKPLTGPTRFQARLGLFYPPVSLEHDGKAWTTTRTITPSAINSWIGEEVFGAGLEVSAKREFAGHELGVTVGGIGKNDTAGTLLSFRGWSLNDVRATLKGEYQLPPMSAFHQSVQPQETYPARELDDRYGYYVRADWKPPAPFTLNAIYYDNLGDMIAVDQDYQWSWYTRFVNVGATWQPTDRTEVLAQYMTGVTRMGYSQPFGRWIDVDFDSAYVLVSQTLTDKDLVTGRLDWFRVDDVASPLYGDLNEDGWAATAAWRRALTKNVQLFLEAVHVDSDRPSRPLAGEKPQQAQTTFQALARFTF